MITTTLRKLTQQSARFTLNIRFHDYAIDFVVNRLGKGGVNKYQKVYIFLDNVDKAIVSCWPRGVMVSTQDSESCDPSSNLGRT